MNEINLSDEDLIKSKTISSRGEDMHLHRIGKMIFAVSEMPKSKLLFAFASSILCAYLDSPGSQKIIKPWIIRKNENPNEKITLALQLKLADGSLAMLTDSGSLYLTTRFERMDTDTPELQLRSPAKYWNLPHCEDLDRMRLTPRMVQIVKDLTANTERKAPLLTTLWSEYRLHEQSTCIGKRYTITGDIMSFVVRPFFDGTVAFDSTH